MKSKDLEMCKINNTKINNYLSPIRSFSMYSIVSRYHHNEWIYVIWDIAEFDWLMCDLLNIVYQLVWRDDDLTWLLHLLICVYMIVQQIDHLFLHISLRQISSSSFLLDLHSKCLKMVWYGILLSSFGQLQSLFYHTLFLSLSLHLLEWEYIPWNRSVTSFLKYMYEQLTNLSKITTTSTS